MSTPRTRLVQWMRPLRLSRVSCTVGGAPLTSIVRRLLNFQEARAITLEWAGTGLFWTL